jgi:C1A family cysteine protease
MKCGWIKDKRDARDYLFRKLYNPLAELPPVTDLRPLCSPVEDQRNLGSCTANALAGAMEYLCVKNKAAYVDFSRLFIYYNERVLEGNVNQDAGAEIRDGIKVLAKFGACPESLWPYIEKRFADAPPPECYNEAEKYQITSYHSIGSLQGIKVCLAEGFPVVLGFAVYESFESWQVAKTGILNMPEASESGIGGHAVMAVGYDDSARRLLVRNSWGNNWGMKGYFTMPYEYITNRNLSDDFWTIRGGEQI